MLTSVTFGSTRRARGLWSDVHQARRGQVGLLCQTSTGTSRLIPSFLSPDSPVAGRTFGTLLYTRSFSTQDSSLSLLNDDSARVSGDETTPSLPLLSNFILLPLSFSPPLYRSQAPRPSQLSSSHSFSSRLMLSATRPSPTPSLFSRSLPVQKMKEGNRFPKLSPSQEGVV